MESTGLGNGKYTKNFGIRWKELQKDVDTPRMIVYNYTRRCVMVKKYIAYLKEMKNKS